MTRRAKLSIVMMIVSMFTLGALVGGCGSWQPAPNEGQCSQGRKWVPPAQDPETGEWKEGYCEWLPGEK